MRRCEGTSEERSGLNQPTNPPGFRFFRPNPAFVEFFSRNFSEQQKIFQGALARAQKSCMQRTENVIYPENLKFCTPTHPFSLPSAEAPTRGSEPENQPTNPSCVYNPRPITHPRLEVHACTVRTLYLGTTGTRFYRCALPRAAPPSGAERALLYIVGF